MKTLATPARLEPPPADLIAVASLMAALADAAGDVLLLSRWLAELEALVTGGEA